MLSNNTAGALVEETVVIREIHRPTGSNNLKNAPTILDLAMAERPKPPFHTRITFLGNKSCSNKEGGKETAAYIVPWQTCQRLRHF